MTCLRPRNSVFFNSTGGLRPDPRYQYDVGNISDFGTLQSYFSQAEKLQEKIDSDINCLECKAITENSSFDPRDTENQSLTTLFLGISNVCNLQCRMCGSHASNQLIERDKNLEFFTDPNWRSDYTKQLTRSQLSQLLNDKSMFSNLSVIKINGGEPFLEDINFEILDWLSPYASQISISILTNATIIPTKDQMNILNKYKSVHVGIGIDAIGPIYEYVRHGASWNQIDSNIQILNNLFDTKYFVSLNAMTVFDMHELIEYIGVKEYNIQTIVNPAYVSHRIFGNKLETIYPQQLISYVPEHPPIDKLIKRFGEYLKYTDAFHDTIAITDIQPKFKSLL